VLLGDLHVYVVVPSSFSSSLLLFHLFLLILFLGPTTILRMADDAAVKSPDSASDEEKAAVAQRDRVEAPNYMTSDLPPDPDAHLSPEERAAIVRLTLHLTSSR
jgi:hypothetical protein